VNDFLRRRLLSSVSEKRERFESVRSRTFCQYRMVITRASERVILDPERPLTCQDPGQVGIVNLYFKIMKRKELSGPDTVQLFTGCITRAGDTNLPEYPYMARRSSYSHNEQLIRCY